MPEQLTTEQVAALAGITPASLREYRRRGAVPGPDGYLGRTPWWHPATIKAWLASRSRSPAQLPGEAGDVDHA